MRVLSVNQDPGIDPARCKGAAVHLRSMREAFTGLGADVIPLDESNEVRLRAQLEEIWREGPVDLIYERYALSKAAAAEFAAAKGVPLILEANAPLADERLRWRGIEESASERQRDRFLFENADGVIAVSSMVAAYARARGARANAVRVFPNGVDPDRFRPRAPGDPQRKELVPDGRFAVGFYGRLRPWHGFERLVEAGAKLLERGAPIHLVLIGEGEFKRYLKGRIAPEHYTLVGWKPHEEVGRYVAAFDALPLAYGPENPCYFSPLKLAESMACGVVPIVPRLGDLDQLVVHGECGLAYPAGDIERLVESIEWLLLHAAARKELAHRAVKRVGAMTWENVARFALAQCTPTRVNSGWGSREPTHRLRELRPQNDTRLPLGRKLGDKLEAGVVEILAYRPERRLVLKLEIDGTTRVVKGYRKRRSIQAAGRYRIAEQTNQVGGFRVPRLLKHRASSESLLLEHLAGRPLDLGEDHAERFFSVGAALRRFQDAEITGPLTSFESSAELGVLKRWARRSIDATSGIPTGWSDAFRALCKAHRSLPQPLRGLTHRDLHDGQILDGEDGLVLLDFDLLCRGDVALDPANLVAHFDLRALQDTRGAQEVSARRCARALLSGLGRATEASFAHRLRFYKATTFLRLALVYRLRPRWASISAPLVELGKRCLDGQ